MSVTIKDVAKLANVATSTVSRVIANNPRISDGTKKKVRDAMHELGYHPNAIARSLASQSTQSLGLIMPRSTDIVFQNPFFLTLLRGISEGAQNAQYTLLMTTGKSDKEIYDGVVQIVQGRKVDGVILLSSQVEDDILSYLYKRKFPFVLIGKPYKYKDKITHVDNDNFSAANEATKHLLTKGHTKIAFIGGSRKLTVTMERLLGYREALETADIPVRDAYCVHEEFLSSGGQEAVKGLLDLPDPPSAMLVTDDLMALGVLRVCNDLGISVPESIAIVSFNNTMMADMSRPPLTSMEINTLDLGYQAVTSLIQHISQPNEPIKRVIIPHSLVIRETT
ncbi:LacI family DNA-binding transcriptional regulator [Aureibacillus halotolerans]|uniref:Catabolite control protein A n=1 Tax=Aureibacillus halotolerans TaxID=1508390 RepID=A0A4R6UAA1_9BACI|nr:LacI family DNA-binding transcriptional regulator [Aureibacillus halotolerans]TDQ42782.1 LacI family transcriptional regulator [Aureibacillus halotolerans]